MSAKKDRGDFFTSLTDYLNMLRADKKEESTASLRHAIEEAMRSIEQRQKKTESLSTEATEASAKRSAKADAISTPIDTPTALFSDGDFFELSMDWENPYLSSGERYGEIIDLPDALVASLSEKGAVDIEYIAARADLTPRQVIDGLGGAIYQNPERWEENLLLGWETSEEYLSGNLARKRKAAEAANRKYGGRFDANVKAIEAVLPPSVATSDIYVTLGSPWVPADIIDDFISHLINSSVYITPPGASVRHDEASGIWEVPYKTRFDFTRHSMKCYTKWGTRQMNMLAIIESTLNMRTISITKTVSSRATKSGKATVIDEDETFLALEKQKEIVKEFEKWIWRDEERKKRLKDIYDNRYGSIRTRHFDGSFLRFPGLNPEIELYPYQKNAVARIIFTPNTLLAHDVGSGKTFEMIAAAMEMRRMGISRKNMFVVPPTLTGQWEEVFRKMYPTARLLVVTNKNFGPRDRQKTLEKMRDGEWDGIIIAYSSFDMIPLSREYYENLYEDGLKEIERSKEKLKSGSSLAAKERSLRGALEKLKKIEETEETVCFDELKINTIFLDEAHNYKNVPTDTKITRVPGISRQGSAKCGAMMDKVHLVQRQNGGRGAVFATGTPITNSITDVFVIQKYLQSGELDLLGLNSFDAWVAMFAEKVTDFEIDVDTSSFRLATRFSKFHNLPELTGILASIADFHRVTGENGIPRFDGYTDVTVEPTPAFCEYLKSISKRADDVRGRRVKREEDNMLKITTDGRKAALDIRLVEEDAVMDFSSKVNSCADRVADIYMKTESDRSAQLVFCDTSTPKDAFNIYDELSRVLVDYYGIPREEIAYIHDATTEKKRAELFSGVKAGKVRVLIGSTFKLGLGVNVQERLIALHHLDVPWRPADMVQREGRILRQGNLNEKVDIYRYITKGSFDAYSWQLLETKQRFISQLLSGSLEERRGADVDSTVLSYAEVKALAIGNPLIKKRVELSNELSRLLILRHSEEEQRQRLGQEKLELPAKIERQKKLLAYAEADAAAAKEISPEEDKEEQKRLRELIDGGVKANIGSPEEKEILIYRGFKVIAPSFMSEDKTFVYLEREGRYLLEVGSELGVLRRIDFYLDELSRQVDKYRATLAALEAREAALAESESTEVGYLEKIEDLKKRIEAIDKTLSKSV